MSTATAPTHETTVLHVGGLHYATEKARVEPLGFVLRPEVGAISMAGSSVIVALNAVALKRLRVQERPGGGGAPPAAAASGEHSQQMPAPDTA